MQDLIGLGFIILVATGAFAGLRSLSRPRISSADEFERKAAEGTTTLGASVNALQELIDPAHAKARIVVEQMKDGRYQKKRREGKAGGVQM